MIDAPGGGGKVPVTPNYIAGRQGGDLVIRNFAGRVYRYHDALEPDVQSSEGIPEKVPIVGNPRPHHI
jgi:hypothetical protein